MAQSAWARNSIRDCLVFCVPNNAVSTKATNIFYANGSLKLNEENWWKAKLCFRLTKRGSPFNRIVFCTKSKKGYSDNLLFVTAWNVYWLLFKLLSVYKRDCAIVCSDIVHNQRLYTFKNAGKQWHCENTINKSNTIIIIKWRLLPLVIATEHAFNSYGFRCACAGVCYFFWWFAMTTAKKLLNSIICALSQLVCAVYSTLDFYGILCVLFYWRICAFEQSVNRKGLMACSHSERSYSLCFAIETLFHIEIVMPALGLANKIKMVYPWNGENKMFIITCAWNMRK